MSFLPDDRRFQILSISGGGYCGLYSASLLADFEKRSREGVLARNFDLLAGTSIGGILALALAAEVPMSRVKEVLEEKGPLIFGTAKAPRSRLGKWTNFAKKAFCAQYRASALRSSLLEVFSPSLRMVDLTHPVIIPAVNLSAGRTQLFKTPHRDDLFADKERLVVDVAMATSAAPTYFPISRINDHIYADGGLFANTPDLLAWHEAQHFMGRNENELHVLSIGTTTSRFSFAIPQNSSFGLFQWTVGSKLARAALASQHQSASFILKHRLGDRYVRLDHELSSDQERELGLDVASKEAQQTLRALASTTAQNHFATDVIQQFLLHRSSPGRYLSNHLSGELG